jgi:hypothetical protein
MTHIAYTLTEIALAQRLFRDAQSNGTLRPGRLLAVAASRGTGLISTARSSTTWQDYLPEARRLLGS